MLTNPLFRKVFLIIGVIVLFVIFVFIERPKRSSQSPPIINSPTPTPIAISYSSQSYTDPGHHYVIQYPQDWIQDTSGTSGSITTFHFSEAGNIYQFDILPPIGNTVPDAGLIGADDVTVVNIQYGARQYKKNIYLANGTPIYLYAGTVDENNSFYSFSMELPPSNREKYMHIFDEILSNMQTYANFNPDEILNPSPTNQ